MHTSASTHAGLSTLAWRPLPNGQFLRWAAMGEEMTETGNRHLLFPLQAGGQDAEAPSEN